MSGDFLLGTDYPPSIYMGTTGVTNIWFSNTIVWPRTPTPTQTQTPSVTPTITPSLSISATPSISILPTPSLSISATPSLSISATPSITPSTSCARPEGLNLYSPFYMYSGVTGYTYFASSAADACDAVQYWFLTAFYGFSLMGDSFNIGDDFYNGIDTSCTKYLGTGYFIIEIASVPTVVYFLNGIFNSYPDCPV